VLTKAGADVPPWLIIGVPTVLGIISWRVHKRGSERALLVARS